MLVAVLSDIHSNLPALQAVARDIDEELKADATYVLGDIVNGCPWPAEVLDLLAERGWPMLLGNHDDAVVQLGTPRMEPRYASRELYGALWWTRERLRPEQVRALANLPLELRVDIPAFAPLRLLHGVPGNFFIGFQPNASDAWVAQRLASVPEPVVAGGHTHVALVRQVEGWMLVNSGSVGMPYDGDKRASYAWLRSQGDGWTGGIRRVAYDTAGVDRAFTASGLLDQAGVMAEMARRSVLTGLPWIADFAWWIRRQPAEQLTNVGAALARYDVLHGPGHWSFPYA